MSGIIVKTFAELSAKTGELHKIVDDFGPACHEHMVDIMRFIVGTRNTTPATDFYVPLLRKAGSKSHSIIRAGAIKAWLEEFAFCKYYVNKKTGVISFKLNSDRLDALSADDLLLHMKTAESTSWNEFTPDPDFKALDFDKMLAALVKRVENALEDEDVPMELRLKHKVDAGKLEQVKALIAA